MMKKDRRDFLKTAGISSAILLSGNLALAGESTSVTVQKKIAQLWQLEKLHADLSAQFARKHNDDILGVIGKWSHLNRKAVLHELIRLYGIDLQFTETQKLLYTAEDITGMEQGKFPSTKWQNQYDTLKGKGDKSLKDALFVLVQLTVEMIEYMKETINISSHKKVKESIAYLSDSSMSHYWSFSKKLREIGVSDGCCAVGRAYCKTPREYPISFGSEHERADKPLSNEMRHALAHMWSEEKMAHDAFEVVYSVYPQLRLFYNIGHWSETQHMTAVEELVALYDIDVNDYTNTQKHYDQKILRKMGPGDYAIEDFETRYNTVLLPYAVQGDIAALKLGCMVEVQDIWDLTGFLGQNNNPYIDRTFKYLIAGSQSHYWAYHHALIAKGISSGCCSAGNDYCKDASEYPSGSHDVGLALRWNQRSTCVKYA
jgi:hypothetical protein